MTLLAMQEGVCTGWLKPQSCVTVLTQEGLLRCHKQVKFLVKNMSDNCDNELDSLWMVIQNRKFGCGELKSVSCSSII